MHGLNIVPLRLKHEKILHRLVFNQPYISAALLGKSLVSSVRAPQPHPHTRSRYR